MTLAPAHPGVPSSPGPWAPPGLVLAAEGHGHFDFRSWTVGEWILFGSAALITIWVLWLAVRATVSPGEEAPDHVKRSILDDDRPPSPPPGPSAAPPSAPSHPSRPL